MGIWHEGIHMRHHGDTTNERLLPDPTKLCFRYINIMAIFQKHSNPRANVHSWVLTTVLTPSELSEKSDGRLKVKMFLQPFSGRACHIHHLHEAPAYIQAKTPPISIGSITAVVNINHTTIWTRKAEISH